MPTAACPNCRQTLDTTGLAGQHVQCPACSNTFQVPADPPPLPASHSRPGSPSTDIAKGILKGWGLMTIISFSVAIGLLVAIIVMFLSCGGCLIIAGQAAR